MGVKLNILTPKTHIVGAKKRLTDQVWWRNVQRCDLHVGEQKRPKRQRKKHIVQTGYSPRPPSSSDRNSILRVGRSPGVVLSSKFRENRLRVSEIQGG